MNELIRVTQLPIIEEHLRSMKETVDRRVEEALSLVCTEESIQSVKTIRADLNKEFQALEEQRKRSKKQFLVPMNSLRLYIRNASATLTKKRTQN